MAHTRRARGTSARRRRAETSCPSIASCSPTATRRSRPTPSWARRPHSFLLEWWSAARSGPPTASSASSRARSCRARGGRVEILRFDVDGGGRRVARGRAPDGDPTRARRRRSWRRSRRRCRPALPRFFGGAVGWLGYDVVRSFEKLPTLRPTSWACPRLCFVVTDTLVIFDNLRQTLKVVATPSSTRPDDGRARPTTRLRAHRRDPRAAGAAGAAAAAARSGAGEPAGRRAAASNTRATSFKARGRAQAKEYILAGDAFQVVLSQRFEAPRGGAIPSTSTARCA